MRTNKRSPQPLCVCLVDARAYAVAISEFVWNVLAGDAQSKRGFGVPCCMHHDTHSLSAVQPMLCLQESLYALAFI